MIEDMFVFTAKDQPTTMEEGSDKLPSSSTSSKRARGVKGTKMEDLRSVGKGSFKSKLLSMRNPRLWTGFGALREKLSIRQEDITISEMPHDNGARPDDSNGRMENRTRFGGGSGKDFDTNIKNINGNRFYKGSVDNSTKARVGSKSKNNTTNGGLRFEILKMDVEENVDKDKGSKVTVASSSKLLADISNDVWDRGKKLGSGSRKKSSKNKCSNFSNGEKSKESVVCSSKNSGGLLKGKN
ncbi:hypothetical protein ACOSP7_014976 [Xanthoceras sorbifolium]